MNHVGNAQNNAKRRSAGELFSIWIQPLKKIIFRAMCEQLVGKS
jgi:hypothetical protein